MAYNSSRQQKLDISVIICTHNRADSLRETIECLKAADRKNIEVEVIVVDNNSKDDTKKIVESFSDQLPVRYLYEPKQGKSHAMNRALDEDALGDIIAFLDDDMSPNVDWFKGVMAISERWPDHDIFTGRSYIIWPSTNIPEWAKCPTLAPWAFSILDYGSRDLQMKKGQWPSGNHFWIRSRVINKKTRFKHIWATEPAFVLELKSDGYRYVTGPDAVSGHRIQPKLLSESVIRQRAVLCGRSSADVRFRAYDTTKQAVFLQKHLISTYIYSIAKLTEWLIRFLFSTVILNKEKKFLQNVNALERISYFSEIINNAYRIRLEWKMKVKSKN